MPTVRLAASVAAGGDLSVGAMVAAVRAESPSLSGREILRAAGELRRAIAGAGVLEDLLREPGVSDICVNGPGDVWIDRGHGLRRSGIVIDSDDELRALAVRLVTSAGQRLDDASPFADARLDDGTRVHALLPPLSPAGVHLSLRVPARSGFDLQDLVRRGSLPVEAVGLLTELVGSGAAFLVTGGTGTGKTTVLGALLGLVPADERVIVIEDSAELRPRHPHVVHLEARRPNAEGRGGVALEELIRQALRMRPDRIVVGEARGAEIGDLLMALNTGHGGGCGTVHADRPEHLPARVEAMASLRGWPREASHSQLAAAVDAVVHLRRLPDGQRVVSCIAVLSRTDATVSTEIAWDFSGGSLRRGPGHGAYQERLRRDRSAADGAGHDRLGDALLSGQPPRP